MLCVCVLFLSSHHSTDGSKGNYRRFKARRPHCRSSGERNPIVERLGMVHFHFTLTDHNKECCVAGVIASLIIPDCAAAKTTQHDTAKRHLQAKIFSSVHDKRPRMTFLFLSSHFVPWYFLIFSYIYIQTILDEQHF